MQLSSLLLLASATNAFVVSPLSKHQKTSVSLTDYEDDFDAPIERMIQVGNVVRSPSFSHSVASSSASFAPVEESIPVMATSHTMETRGTFLIGHGEPFDEVASEKQKSSVAVLNDEEHFKHYFPATGLLGEGETLGVPKWLQNFFNMDNSDAQDVMDGLNDVNESDFKELF